MVDRIPDRIASGPPRARWIAGVVAAAWLAGAYETPAEAQFTDVELDRGPTAELYIRKRPSIPESPKLPQAMEDMLGEREKARDAKRKQAIELLEQFLASDPTGDAHAEGLFKLAELKWEEARIDFIRDMDVYERKLEACKEETSKCKRPKEPTIDLEEPAALYKQILDEHPQFRRTDLVLYLVGFAAREKMRHEEAFGYFNQVIERFPDSPLYGDAWMMIGEHHFAATQWVNARDAYANILARPESATYDLALFKTAWCDWKLGEIEEAAKKFTKVLQLAVEAETSGNRRAKEKGAQLKDEALQYLVIVFTEDRAISAKEVYDFLASIGGERFSKDVLVRVAQSYYDQSEYDRAVNTYQFLIEQTPEHLDAAGYQRKIVEAYVDGLDQENTLEQMKVLVDGYGPDSAWAKANKQYPSRLRRSLTLTERLVRNTATNYHALAQADEKQNKRANLNLYRTAAASYSYYLSRYDEHKNAASVRFRRAEILYYKLNEYENAGDEYLAVGKTKPTSEKQKQTLHKEALLKAMEAFEKARPKNIDTSKRRELLPADRKFAATVGLYAELFPADPEIVGILFRNGQLFYDYGDYDEAIKQFGVIVTQYPDDPNAGPAGDRILKALAQGKDYENIESWARKLKKAKAFESPEQQARMDRLIVDSIMKSGEKYEAGKEYGKAASFYLRVPKEFPKHKRAAQSYMNAGVMFEKDKQPQKAANAYLAMASRYGKDHPKMGAKAAFTAGKVYESVAYFDKAVEAYEIVITDFKRSRYAGDAMFNAGVLRQALGQHDRAIKHYKTYAKRNRSRKDAPEVAFRIGVVYEEAGDAKQAYQSFATYARKYRREKASVIIQAETRAGRTALGLGRTRQAAKHFKTALKLYKKLTKRKSKDAEAASAWAAEARYHEGELIFRQYEAIKLDVKPRKLQKQLKKKFKMLEKAKKVYADVVDFGDPQWATAALYRYGNIFQVFADSLRNAPIPPGFSKAEATQYREELENFIIEVEEGAIESYTFAYQKSLELEVYSGYTRKIREALGKLDSSTFPPVIEARSRERFGNRPLPPELVTEVIRDEE